LNPRGVFVAGTDTGIGKTHASVALLRAYRAQGCSAIGMKPIASGCRETAEGLRNDDAAALIGASEPMPAYELCNPYALPLAIAPHLAARDAGIEIALETIIDAYRKLAARADRVVVEGVGGWAVPLSDTMMQADLVRALGIPVLLVVGLRLGCINHALMSVRTVLADGCELAGWIANRIDPAMASAEANIDTLRERISAPLLGVIAHRGSSGDGDDIEALSQAALQI
jgi:dethiobiotin synthetase